MKNQGLFSSKDKSKKLKCCLLQFLFGALKIKLLFMRENYMANVCQWPARPNGTFSSALFADFLSLVYWLRQCDN